MANVVTETANNPTKAAVPVEAPVEELVVLTAEGPDAIYKVIPEDDIPPGWQAGPGTITIESPAGGWNSKSGRPAYNLPRGKVEPFVVPTEWGPQMFALRLRQLQWAGNWSDARRRGVHVSLLRFLDRLARQEYKNTAEAIAGAITEIEQDWIGWTGRKTHTLVEQLAEEVYNSDWRLDLKAIDIRQRVMMFPGTPGQARMDHRQLTTIADALERMMAKDLTFASDGDRWASLRDHAKRISPNWHMAYSDTEGTKALRDLMRELWPDSPTALPADITALSEGEAKLALHVERVRTKAAHAELWRKAEERGWCPEFDAILIRAGYPPRPTSYKITYKVTFTKPLTPQEAYSMTGVKLVFVDGAVTYSNTISASEIMPLETKPTVAQARDLLTDDMISAALRANGIDQNGTTITEVAVATVATHNGRREF